LELSNPDKWIKFVCELDAGHGHSPKRLLNNLASF
jgi:hypothetical protein